MKRIPCIKITNQKWSYLKPILRSLGYNTSLVDDKAFTQHPFLLLDAGGKIGYCSNLPSPYTPANPFREIIEDEEKFLELAASLTGRIYKKKDSSKSSLSPNKEISDQE